MESNAQSNPEAYAFSDLPTLISISAKERPTSTAVVEGALRIDYATLNAQMLKVAASLQRSGLHSQDCVAICAGSSFAYLSVFLGALYAGISVAPLSSSATVGQILAMVKDSNAKLLFVDESTSDALAASDFSLPKEVDFIRLSDGEENTFNQWLVGPTDLADDVRISPDWAFNIIYSSGTTGTPKGIVHSHQMRWLQMQYMPHFGYTNKTVTLIATPLYSNTTMTSLLPTLAFGGCVVLMPKFEVQRYLELAQRERTTHAMLVPVQYQRLMSYPDFGKYNLDSFLVKFSTSAPLSAALKSDIVARWPGVFVEFYGMTEGGGTCMLVSHLHPNKFHTVGKPVDGHDFRVIDENGAEVPQGAVGEIVGRSTTMMIGYHNQPNKTSEAEWTNAQGQRYIRTGDIGRFDEDGFLILLDRRKDMIISGGFNVYPSDIESVLHKHPSVQDAAVVGAPSVDWGEVPVAYVVLKEFANISADEMVEWTNAQVGKTQRLKGLRFINELPLSPIGKVLKRELRDRW
jgi:acyl-CoA synthetase (AMP-forming)/AMP-acid ligase II